MGHFHGYGEVDTSPRKVDAIRLWADTSPRAAQNQTENRTFSWLRRSGHIPEKSPMKYGFGRPNPGRGPKIKPKKGNFIGYGEVALSPRNIYETTRRYAISYAGVRKKKKK